jgi:hypothetical protein
MPNHMTWKAVFFIWMLAMPFVAGAGFIAYQKDPAPFKAAAKFTLKEVQVGKKAYGAYQAKKAVEDAAAAKKAKEEEQASSPQF